MRVTAADHIASFLADRGVEVIFGLCGHTNISLLAALERAGAPRFVTTRHEQVAAHAADGYARASGRPGVVLLHVGPGMTNAVTGVATASFDSVPLIVIAGDVPSYYEGRGPHQEVNLRRDADQVSIYEPFVKRAWRVRRADQLPRMMARAWDLAVAGRPGPVIVSIPMDILGEALDAPIWPASPVERPALSTATASAIATELRIAQRPLLLAGGGTRRATAQVVRLAETVGLPVAHTLMGTGVLPPDHPQLVGIVGFWGSPAANRLAAEADVILAVGTRFPETDSSSWEPGVTFNVPPTRLIHVDIDPHEPGETTPPPSPPRPTLVRRSRRSSRRTDSRRPIEASTGRACATSERRSWRRAGPTRPRPTFRSCPSGSWPICVARSQTPSWSRTSAGTRTASRNSTRSTHPNCS